MKLFGGKIAEIEAKNRMLTDAARKRAERVEQLENQLDQLQAERTHLSNRVVELEKLIETLKVERAHYADRAAELEQHDRQLTEAATESARQAQRLEQDLLAARTEIATRDFPRLEAERAFYQKRVAELEEHNRLLTEAATKYASRAQELERELAEAKSALIRT